MLFSPAVKVPLGVLGGWLAIMAPAVVTIALRLREFDRSGLPSTYAWILALGWLTMIAALIGSGYASDAVARRFGTRFTLARFAVPFIALGGVLLAIAPSPTWLALTWMAAQIPSALVMTTALAMGGDVVSPKRRGLTSGLVGAAPIVALLLGGIAVRLLSDHLAWAFVLPALVGAAVAVPVIFAGSPTGLDVKTDHPPLSPAPQGRGSGSVLWIAFLAGSFMLAWATATTNGFLVTFVQYVIAVPDSEISGLSSSVVIVASVLAVATSVGAGMLTAGRPVSVRVWIAAGVLCAVALGMLAVVPSVTTLFVAGIIFGVAFGAANGVEFTVVLLTRRDRTKLGSDFGLFTAVTSAPYVLVPALATLLLARDAGAGVQFLFTLAGALAVAAALTVAGAERAQSHQNYRSRAPH